MRSFGQKINSAVAVALFAVCALFVYSLIFRVPHLDDAWISEWAFWQSKLGYAKSELMRGVTRQEWRHVVHHKLLTLQGALAIRLFGFSLPVLKSVSLLYLGAFLWLFYRRLKAMAIQPATVSLVFLLLIANAFIFEYAFVFRPEIPVMTLGFASFLLLEDALRRHAGWSVLQASAGGLLAGLSMATHLNGVVFFMAGAFLLAVYREWRLIPGFTLAFVAGFAPYAYDIHSLDDVQLALYQLRDSPSVALSGEYPFPLGIVVRFVKEHERFFHSPKEIALSLLFLTVLATHFTSIRRNSVIGIYLSALVVGLALLSVHKTSKYLLLYMPYLFLLLGAGLDAWMDQPRQTRSSRLLLSLLLMYLGVQIFYDGRLAVQKFHPATNRALTLAFMGNRPDTCAIVAPMTFIFNEIERFERIQGGLCYLELQKQHPEIYGVGFLEWTRRYGIDVIVLSTPEAKKLGMYDLDTQACAAAGFEVTGRTPEHLVLRRK